MRRLTKGLFGLTLSEYTLEILFKCKGQGYLIAILISRVNKLDAYYWNYKTNPKEQDKSWGNSKYTDFKGFKCEALKMCSVEQSKESQIRERLKIAFCKMGFMLCGRFDTNLGGVAGYID